MLPFRHFVEHSWEMSASDLLLAVADFCKSGWTSAKGKKGNVERLVVRENFR